MYDNVAFSENIHTQFFKINYEAKLEFLEGWEGFDQKTYHERGMDIFFGTTQFKFS